MKFPSISQVQKEASTAFLRFPLSLIFGIISAAIACYLIEVNSTDDHLTWVNLLLTSALGLPLFFCIDTFAEKQGLSGSKKLLAYLPGLLILIVIYLSFPGKDSFTNTMAPYIRYTIYNLSIHLMVSFVPFLGNSDQLDFWNYNKSIFLRLVTGVFYSLVIFIGIALALGAIKMLFDVHFDENIFAKIFAIIAFIFNTWFFLAGAPKVNSTTDPSISYPKGLKIFTQFILIPLLLVYLLILYLYGAKILITGAWPEGIVSYMIIAISVLGIFTNLLLYPYQQWKDSGWVSIFYRTYYVLLLPLIVLLFLAIGIRVQDYGLTVNRYIIICLGVWLMAASLYYVFGRKNIKFIPISLAAFMILSSFGPWGMFSLSESRQINRLSNILTDNGILVDGRVVNEVNWTISDEGIPTPIKDQTNSLPINDLKEVNSIVQYLEDYHGVSGLYSWFDQDIKSVLTKADYTKSSSLNSSKTIVIAMGLKYLNRYETRINLEQEVIQYMSIQANDAYEVLLTDFDYFVTLNLNKWDTPPTSSIPIFIVKINPKNSAEIVIERDGKEIAVNLTEFITQKNRINPEGYFELSSEELIIEEENDKLKVLIQIRDLQAQIEGKEVEIENLKGLLFLKIK